LFKRELPDRNDLLKGEISINDEECIYCSACAELCPADAITVVNTPDACSIEVDEDKCVYCGVCKRVCPQEAIRTVCVTCMHSDEIEKPAITGDIFIGSDCINCGWCKEICPVDAAEVTKPFDGEITTTEEDCVGCGSCVDLCACNAIVLEDNVAKFNDEYCVLCGACTKVCPQERIVVKRTDMKLTNVSSASWKAALERLLD
jgi:4Fe-4S ferredoxin